MDVLVVGSGGREHALTWKLKQSPRIDKLYIAPGNAGTWNLARSVPIDQMDFESLSRFVEEKHIGLTVVGPDNVFAGGIVDFFEARGLRIWGPTKAAAQLEWSKAFSKQLMKEVGVPTARFETFSDYNHALAYLRLHKGPIVIKASGLALGKGVYVCETFEEGDTALKDILVNKVHGDAGAEVILEEFISGPEISIHALTDGQSFITFPPSQDHKRALDGDKGKNTGGMGAIMPLPWMTPELLATIENRVIHATIQKMADRNTQYKGLLYPGLIVTTEGPKVLEFNARFGDPEAQVYMRLMATDLLDLLEACIDGTISSQSIQWQHGAAVNVVLASGGYPDAYQKGFPITGIEQAEKVPGVVVFHAGTTMKDGQVVTNGGRVLGVSATGPLLKHALDSAYHAISKIHFEGMQYRTDIGAKAL